MYVRRLEQRNLGEKMEIKEMNQTQPPLWLVNNILFWYEGENPTGNESERKQYFLQHKGKHSNSKKAYMVRSKSTGRKVGYAAVFADTIRRSWNNSNKRDKRKKGNKMGNIYRLVDSMLAIENNKKNHPILNQIYDILTELHSVKSLHT